jgi:hypothetical protein
MYTGANNGIEEGISMRTTGMIMGIIGGALALLFGIIFILCSTLFFNINSWDFYSSYSQQTAFTTGGTMFLVFGICSAVAGVIGLVGGLLVKKKNVAAGVMMIIAAVLSLFNIISLALFILGGVFALMRDRQQPAYAPPYPMPPNYPYPPYYPQQPYPPQSPPENPQP